MMPPMMRKEMSHGAHLHCSSMGLFQHHLHEMSMGRKHLSIVLDGLAHGDAHGDEHCQPGLLTFPMGMF
eukprot:1140104-Pelagomonas_calceolata.AAC.4